MRQVQDNANFLSAQVRVHGVDVQAIRQDLLHFQLGRGAAGIGTWCVRHRAGFRHAHWPRGDCRCLVDALFQVEPYGLDVCSGVRTAGQLDADKLRRFVAAARRWSTS